MTPEQWDIVSGWLAAWRQADPAARKQLRATLAAEHPDLLREAEELATATGELHGFLDTPAVVLASHEIADDEPLLTAGALIGPYRVVELIARGGMGDVYRAHDVRLQRDVAVKVLARNSTGDPQRVERFMQEARLTASLQHPNIVRLYDVGRVGDRAYQVSELLEGETLRARINRGPIPSDEVIRLGIDVANGLVAAHGAGLVHRDLKPDNVFLTESGAKILDFGIAKLSQHDAIRSGVATITGVVVGTAGYLSPEQITGAAVDARADLFSLGALLYEMTTGTRAFGRTHTVETLHAILHDDPPDVASVGANVPAGLAAVVARLLEKSPDARFRSAGEVIAALRAFGGEPAGSRGIGGRRAFRVAVTLAGLAVAAVAVWQFMARGPAGGTGPAEMLAVVPFRSIPASPESDSLALGLADVLIVRLQSAGVPVLPLTATETIGAEDAAAHVLRRGATRLLTGMLQRDGHSVRANVRLLAARDGRVIWSTTVPADSASSFAIQDTVIAGVIAELAPHLPAARRRPPVRCDTRHAQAYELYLRGLGLIRRPNAPELMRAAALFQQATELDPQCADAWAGLASAYKRLPVAGSADLTAFARAKDAATRTLALDSEHPEALSALGTVAFWHEWDYARAEHLLRRAVELQPNNVDAHNFLAHVLSNTGRHQEALDEIKRARQLDPSWSVARALEGQFLHMAGDAKEAVRKLDELLQDDPTFWSAQYFRQSALVTLGRYEDALRAGDDLLELRRKLNPSAGPYLGALTYKACALAGMGRRQDAEAMLEQIRNLSRGRTAMSEATVLNALGRDAEALEQIRKAIELRTITVTFLGVHPQWDNLRANPTFRELAGQVNLREVSDLRRR